MPQTQHKSNKNSKLFTIKCVFIICGEGRDLRGCGIYGKENM
jgi:hypothetical protein